MNWSNMLIVALCAPAIAFFSISYPESFLGITLAVFWGLVLMLALYRIGRRSLGGKWLMGVVVAGLFFRIPMVLAHLAVGLWIYGAQVDFPGFFSSGAELGGRLLTGDLALFDLPYFDLEQPDVAVVTRLWALTYLLIGPSLPGMFLWSGVIGFLGSYLFLRAFQAEFPSARETRFLPVCLFFFPSLAFWTSLLGKESWVFFFLGWATYAMAHLLQAISARYLLGLLVSVTFITLIRPPIGLALAAGIGMSFILTLYSRVGVRGPIAILRPVVHISASLAIVGALTIASLPMRQYHTFSEGTTPADAMLNLAMKKHAGLSTDPTAGGSSLPIQIEDPSAFEIVRFLPGAMFTFLFRPLVFEAHNVLALIAALDATLLLTLVLWRWRHALAAMRCAWSQPFVAFCSVVFLLFTAGLSFEANFGVIVRHRAMVLPFLFILLSVPLRKRGSTGFRVNWDSESRGLVPAGSAELER